MCSKIDMLLKVECVQYSIESLDVSFENIIYMYIEITSNNKTFQSAYKAFHSTETALLSVTNDILGSMGRGNVTALTLLDLSAAFDTIDHKLLLDRLEEWFGIRGDAFRWVESYLSDRCQLISIQGKLSIPMSLIYGSRCFYCSG